MVSKQAGKERADCRSDQGVATDASKPLRWAREVSQSVERRFDAGPPNDRLGRTLSSKQPARISEIAACVCLSLQTYGATVVLVLCAAVHSAVRMAFLRCSVRKWEFANRGAPCLRASIPPCRRLFERWSQPLGVTEARFIPPFRVQAAILQPSQKLLALIRRPNAVVSATDPKGTQCCDQNEARPQDPFLRGDVLSGRVDPGRRVAFREMAVHDSMQCGRIDPLSPGPVRGSTVINPKLAASNRHGHPCLRDGMRSRPLDPGVVRQAAAQERDVADISAAKPMRAILGVERSDFRERTDILRRQQLPTRTWVSSDGCQFARRRQSIQVRPLQAHSD
jgi:hypothetical protein